MNTGRKGKKPDDDISPYNGGLFLPDETLDNIKVSDDMLHDYTLKLSKYDYDTEIDVNILGHIFEHSLSEIENIEACLRGENVEKNKSRRKKEGIFYTPKYITKYIVDHTVGRLCDEKKAELEIADEFYTDVKRRSRKRIGNLEAYRKWLLELTICDPACGSGAFLNQALEFLINEHQYLDELTAKYHNSPLVLTDIENTILEKNLYGVDINDESVDIARLSLWLRTARKGRKLSTLSANIKCGNSLIDDPAVAGDKAFNWFEQFPQVFKHYRKPKTGVDKEEAEPGDKAYLDEMQEPSYSYKPGSKGFKKYGFDVVIGNPPYVKLETIKEVSQSLEKLNYKTFDKRGDLYVLFVEKGFSILKENGTISYIMPNKWLQTGYGQKLREFFLTKQLDQLIDFGDIQIFEGATTYPVIFIARQNNPNEIFLASLLKESGVLDFKRNVENTAEVFKSHDFSGDTWVISSGENQQLLNKLNLKFKSLKEFVNGEANYGIKFGLTEAFLIDEEKKRELVNRDSNSEKILGSILRGRDLTRYGRPITRMTWIVLFLQVSVVINLLKKITLLFTNI